MFIKEKTRFSSNQILHFATIRSKIVAFGSKYLCENVRVLKMLLKSKVFQPVNLKEMKMKCENQMKFLLKGNDIRKSNSIFIFYFIVTKNLDYCGQLASGKNCNC
ncbi:CLUMA_CG000917, isoform A [Clunio marinus]|uniref:CLUMA_CG000917, isoform A n=1 Tax=Clunio marinus TaxID=568069 RepID=A0A1J1HLB6_9DIPT|nr:CLUMA_CG000917, isoform A [Clunio marinus]